MTRAIVLTVSALVGIGAGALAQMKPHMPADVGPGRVAWFDISTTNLDRAKDFYGKLFDWTFTAVAGTSQAVEINSRGTAIGTIRGAEGAISGFNGVVYIQVDDIQAASNKAKALGATVVPGFPFNLPNGTGAISLITDPSGHPLGLYSRSSIPAKAP
jgi:predicted enzyme related to lactoylglutathione lyase